MAKKDLKLTATKRTWRNIDQSFCHKKVTGLARFRRWKMFFKLWGCSMAVVIIVAIVAYGIYFAGDNLRHLSLGNGGKPVSIVYFQSDGVLDREWFHKVVQLPADQGIMGLDIFDIKMTLEQFGQVKSAAVSIRLPDQLNIKIAERRPVIRVRTATQKGGVKQMLVAADGVVYIGFGYPGSTLKHLPYLSGLRLKRGKQGIEPIAGMDTVADLLSMARALLPEIYATWNVVSFKKFNGNTDDPDAFITVRGSMIREIIFAPDNFEEQLERLNSIVSYSSRNYPNGIKCVDLSLEGQAVVRYNHRLGPRQIMF